MKHVFKKTYIFNGKEHQDIELDIENLTVSDYELADKQFKSLNPNFSGVVETENQFLKQIMVNSSKKPLDFFNALPIYEFVKLKYAVQGFLFGASVEDFVI